MSAPKIFILRMRDIIYTAVFVLVAILLIFTLIYMFMPRDSGRMEESSQYYSGVYTSSLLIDNQVVSVDVTVYDHEIQNIKFRNLDPSLSVMYPLLEETMVGINKQMDKEKDIEKVKPEEDAKETTATILRAVEMAYQKAAY